jgi:hypothetical protein
MQLRQWTLKWRLEIESIISKIVNNLLVSSFIMLLYFKEMLFLLKLLFLFFDSFDFIYFLLLILENGYIVNFPPVQIEIVVLIKVILVLRLSGTLVFG